MASRLDGVVVVLVEDDDDTRAAVQLMLRFQGAHVLSAPNADAALTMLGLIRPTVVVSDIVMPGADGWWMVAEARRRGYLQDVPKIATTSLDIQPEEVRSRGFDAYLRKPVDLAVLCATIDALTRGQTAA